MLWVLILLVFGFGGFGGGLVVYYLVVCFFILLRGLLGLFVLVGLRVCVWWLWFVVWLGCCFALVVSWLFIFVWFCYVLGWVLWLCIVVCDLVGLLFLLSYFFCFF